MNRRANLRPAASIVTDLDLANRQAKLTGNDEMPGLMKSGTSKEIVVHFQCRCLRQR